MAMQGYNNLAVSATTDDQKTRKWATDERGLERKKTGNFE